MSEFDILLEEHASSDCKECLIKAYNLGAREELKRWKLFFENNYYDDLVIMVEKRLRELEKL